MTDARARPCPTREQEAGRPSVVMLVVLLSAMFIAQFDFFVVNVAAPSLEQDLGADATALELIVGGYAFAYASGMVTGGRLGDIFGHRRLFIIGMVAFGVASLLCGIAVGPGQLVAARLAQGFAGALMVPQVLATITAEFPSAARPQAIAGYGVAAGIGSVAGQLLGGVLLNADLAGLGWRVIFLINVPVCAVAALVASRVLPSQRPAHELGGLDPVGAVGISAGLALILVPLALGHSSGWPLWSWSCLVAGVTAVALTLAWERRLGGRGGSPVLDLTLFHGPSFRAGIIACTTFYGYFGSFMFTLTLLLQGGLGLSPLGAGLVFTPMGISYMATSIAGRTWVARYGMSALVVGSGVTSLGLLALAVRLYLSGAGTGVAWICGCLCLIGLGNGVVLPALIGAALMHVPARKAGVASGALTTAQQFASSAGVATIGAVFFAISGGRGGGSGHPIAMVAAAGICLLLVLAVMRQAWLFRSIAIRLRADG